ncbi:MAG TPA: T9SS type A sorting domain-containing protein [Chitinophagales bacterium]|nr:T9SS type A sorting domain-containing protein [Chitinophagales bacterium]
MVKNNNGFTDTPNQFALELPGIKRVSKNDLRIFHNPASGQLHIQYNNSLSAVTISVYNNSGQPILKQEMKGTDCVLNTETLAAGYYTLKIYGRGVDIKQNFTIVKQ